MTKTSTSTNFVNSLNTQLVEKVADETDQQDELFYNSIKSKLNELVKNPSDEVINRILAYSKKK
ncbi:hypothetical protein [Pedobacter boryungensis]|uniref:Uncharacterized protein n=1 Tax=Pedobacter boryungensis TaxID=869962 RepID=A0ABX2DGI2_9SPHI|nr:hypothetical protein [Pedobacter boryungensis]NQX33085.1 hypothetical protein [Pedobacter boryungensis]